MAGGGAARDRRRPRRRRRAWPSCSAIWLVKLSRAQLERLYDPLMQALADADNLAAYLPRPASTPGSRRRAGPLTIRRDEDLKRAEVNHTRAIRSGEDDARRAAPQDQRGLRRPR